jgi:thiol-disulfide isomerase/thioredoxin
MSGRFRVTLTKPAVVYMALVVMLGLLIAGGVRWVAHNADKGVPPDFALVWVQQPTSQVQAAASPQSLNAWLRQHQGHAVALHLWAQWCSVCKQEAPIVTQIASDWPVLTIVSRSGSIGQAIQAVQTRSLPWAVVADESGQIAQTLVGHAGVPDWVIIDPFGHVRARTHGAVSEWGVRARLWWAEHF